MKSIFNYTGLKFPLMTTLCKVGLEVVILLTIICIFGQYQINKHTHVSSKGLNSRKNNFTIRIQQISTDNRNNSQTIDKIHVKIKSDNAAEIEIKTEQEEPDQANSEIDGSKGSIETGNEAESNGEENNNKEWKNVDKAGNNDNTDINDGKPYTVRNVNQNGIKRTGDNNIDGLPSFDGREKVIQNSENDKEILNNNNRNGNPNIHDVITGNEASRDGNKYVDITGRFDVEDHEKVVKTKDDGSNIHVKDRSENTYHSDESNLHGTVIQPSASNIQNKEILNVNNIKTVSEPGKKEAYNKSTVSDNKKISSTIDDNKLLDSEDVHQQQKGSATQKPAVHLQSSLRNKFLSTKKPSYYHSRYNRPQILNKLEIASKYEIRKSTKKPPSYQSRYNRPQILNKLDIASKYEIKKSTKKPSSYKSYLFNRDSNLYLGKAKLKQTELFDDPIKRAVSPSSGGVWPRPRMTRPSSTIVHRLNAEDFEFIKSPTTNCDILNEALQRYKKEIHQYSIYNQELHRVGAKLYYIKDDKALRNIYNISIVLVKDQCNGVYPPVKMDESYSIFLKSNQPVIKAITIWGMLRALETFYQLLYIPEKYDNTLHLKSTDITDSPEHWYRGILVDTARHYISKSTLLTNLDAMSQNKMNVMHWHIVDDQSFPFKSEKFPNLWKKGAYAPHLVYSHQDIQEIVDYARLRGIRVMPEFDTPGHTRGWLGQPGLLSECGEDSVQNTGVFDVTKEQNYQFLGEFFKEVRGAFKDNMIHLGGDEVSMKCWYSNETILKVLQNKTHHELLNTYFTRLHTILNNIDNDWMTIVWEEVNHMYNVKLNKTKTIVEIWQRSEALYEALRDGFDVIHSACWYMDHYNKFGADWAKYYDCTPYKYKSKQAFEEQYDGRIVGGEACMWAEFIDDNNIIQWLWPRAQAPAERLWYNGITRSNEIDVQRRFQEQACRMWRRGIKVSPHNGPGHCSGRMPFDEDLSKHYKQHPEPNAF